MLPPQLRQTRGLRPSLCTLQSINRINSPAPAQACSFSYWHKKRDWLSPLDPLYERYLRKRNITTRAELKKAILRQQKWVKTTPCLVSWGTRHASHSKKPSRMPMEENKEGHASSRFPKHDRKQRLDRIRQGIDAKIAEDPYEAFFGKRFEPFWSRLMPDFLKQEMAWQTPVEAEAASHTAQPRLSKSERNSLSRSTSFQMRSSSKSGSEPTINAWSSSWDAKSNQTRRLVYDPIIGRMVPVEIKADSSEALTEAQQQDQDPPLSKDNIDQLTASDVRASMGKNKQSAVNHLGDRTQQLATLEEEFKNRKLDSEHEELLEARKNLEALRAQVQILERRAHSSTMTKPEDALDAERPAVFEPGWNEAPQGMQIAFATEKEEISHGDKKSLEQEMTALNSPPVQEINDGYEPAPIGMQTQYEQENSSHGTKPSLEQEMVALNKEPVVVVNDGYSTAPSGLQTQFKQEDVDALEHELNEELGRKEVVDDGYSTAPSGMQTLYEREGSDTLEQELAEKLKRKEFDDGYSKVPIGMQTAYKKEDADSLEQELNDKLKRKEFDDGYSKAPIGMQTAYDKEDPGVLEKELNEKLKSEEYDDGYSETPIGMQTIYEKENPGVLEQELSEKVSRQGYDDGYSNTPIGMQTLYKKEDAGDLEKELNATLHLKDHDDGYSTAPKGMQSLFEQEQKRVRQGSARSLEEEMQDRIESKPYGDGYSTDPIGLQTTFDMERQQSTSGKRDSLEQEMTSKMEDPPSDSGYATMPIGLQVLFRQEQLEAEENKRKSLEDELKIVRNRTAQTNLDTEIQTQKTKMQDHEDGYSRTPMGMQSSFRDEEQMKAMQGEGDLCPNVGKFYNSRRWYKQPASNNLSEDIQKAQQRALDRALVREVRDIYENQYGPITTEHQQTQLAPRTEGVVDDTVHKALEQHDQDGGTKACEFKGDDLEQELEGKSTTTTISGSASSKAYEFKEDNLEQELKGISTTTTTSGPASSAAPAEPSSSPAVEPSKAKWAEPAVYKVIAYDVHKEAISITTTPSNFSGSEKPISISSALSRLYQPARFIPHFAELQKEGYQVINASRDWIVLREVESGDSSAKTETFVNPIDPKMMRRIPYEELPTGRFASPTGFVNHDPIFPPEPQQPPSGETVTVEIPVHGGPDVDRYRHRRVRREEPVFSSSKRWNDRRRDGRDGRRKRRFRDRITWALSVGVGTAVSMYVVGVISELAKERNNEK
ncbi:hypothetical protein BDV97DRAFT_75395 [Delphinella strobiligena]|nr:hypothetical protein BDV97DRAFT_75395 [Delphinella strobiligena]